ncbi:hypothetical protein [Paenibacillus sp. SN-8-1]|uniref:hypothetical protein n=1 Tax=Paenibacillus sp. SN-8-1 TaxID=3435409 RepID=UPI003D9A3113
MPLYERKSNAKQPIAGRIPRSPREIRSKISVSAQDGAWSSSSAPDQTTRQG